MVPVVAGVVLKRKGAYLLVQERGPAAYGLWNLPAGRVDVGETIEHAAVREAKEEVGYDVALGRKLGVFQRAATDPPKHAFEATIAGGKLRVPKDELLDARWFTFEEIESMQGKLRGEWIMEAVCILEGRSPPETPRSV
ncbi:MAG: NUDIX hydrolase [Candidatus Aenigmarchaeota archaeon]|nr:NUDIX hydrolase [Candidatus Aenigmarchaeota archaeon]